MADIFIGNIKGPQGDTGPQGNQGEKGDAATISVGSVTTTQYGQTARVTNSGTAHDAVFDFVIPQGRPGEQTTRIDNLLLDALTEPSASFPVPAVGDNGSTLFGKISKWFSDMAALVATKLDAANVVNNLTTTASGYALDARQGKVLKDEIVYEDFSVTLTSASGRTEMLQTAKANYKLIGATFVQNNDLYYLSVSDGVYPALSVLNNNQTQILGMNNNLSVSTNRTLVIRCIYKAN